MSPMCLVNVFLQRASYGKMEYQNAARDSGGVPLPLWSAFNDRIQNVDQKMVVQEFAVIPTAPQKPQPQSDKRTHSYSMKCGEYSTVKVEKR
jgi:hypothetical protein